MTACGDDVYPRLPKTSTSLAHLTAHVEDYHGKNTYPLIICYIAIEHGNLYQFIVDLPIENGGSFHSYVNVYQRVPMFQRAVFHGKTPPCLSSMVPSPATWRSCTRRCKRCPWDRGSKPWLSLKQEIHGKIQVMTNSLPWKIPTINGGF